MRNPVSMSIDRHKSADGREKGSVINIGMAEKRALIANGYCNKKIPQDTEMMPVVAAITLMASARFSGNMGCCCCCPESSFRPLRKAMVLSANVNENKDAALKIARNRPCEIFEA